MKIESRMDAVAENFPIKLLGISWQHELDGGNLQLGKFLHCYVSYPSCWNIIVIP